MVVGNKLSVGQIGTGVVLNMSSTGIAFNTRDEVECGSFVNVWIAWLSDPSDCVTTLQAYGRIVRNSQAVTAIQVWRYEYSRQEWNRPPLNDCLGSVTNDLDGRCAEFLGRYSNKKNVTAQMLVNCEIILSHNRATLVPSCSVTIISTIQTDYLNIVDWFHGRLGVTRFTLTSIFRR
jgi:hypothetical protein